MLPQTITKVIILLCFIQNLNADNTENNPKGVSPIQEAIQNINPVLDRIKLRLKELKLDIYKILLNALMESHSAISKSEKQLLDEINNFETNTNKVIDATNEGHIDIEQCLSKQKEQMERILMVANSKASRNSEENQLQLSNFTEKANGVINEANDIEKNLDKMIGYCIRQNNLLWQKDKLIECLFKEADYVNGIVHNFYKDKDLIQENINNILNDTRTNQNGLLDWLFKTQEEFFKCIELGTAGYPDNTTDVGSVIADTSGKEEKNNEGSQKVNNSVKDIWISERIRKLEDLVNRLKVLHQTENPGNSKVSTSSTSKGKELNTYLSNMGFKPDPSGQSDGKDKKFILYISF